MARIDKPSAVYRVDIVEYERGWGSKVEESIYYDNEDEAKLYAKHYNEAHNPVLKSGESVPDYYVVAQYVGRTG
jgi:hypothetical protein